MDLNPEDPRWELIRAYADGSADEPALRALEEALRNDPTLRARFRDYLNVDGSLALHALGASARLAAQAERRPSRMRLAAGVAAVLAIVYNLILSKERWPVNRAGLKEQDRLVGHLLARQAQRCRASTVQVAAQRVK